jgi:enterochelin esterase family protein
VPHGELHHHFYGSKIAVGLPRGQSDYFVYTPPGYDPGGAPYPVLYLLHGYSDMADDWTTIGGANFILDALIAAGKAKPMVVVMPLGYGDMSLINGDWKSQIGRSNALFSQVLISEIMPQVERHYHVSTDAKDRAITGLSMGGLQSLDIGLHHPDLFAWVGGFSPADFLQFGSKPLPSGEAANLKLLWIACGTDDTLIGPTRAAVSTLGTLHYKVTAIETPGAHAWVVWHDNLIHFAPLLFQETP